MDARFVFAGSAAFGAVAVSLVIALVIGFASSWRVLGAKTAPYLRNE
jgi:predicted lysophospholipase L1 biosynthesis ABC-type transport system permease subunit